MPAVSAFRHSVPVRFDTQVVVITGAARGLGRAYALTVAGRVGAVVVNDLGGSVAGDGRSASPAEIGTLLNRDKNTLESLVANETLQSELRTINAKSTSDPSYLAQLDDEWLAAKDDTDPLIHSAVNNQTADEFREYQGRFPEFAEIFLHEQIRWNDSSHESYLRLLSGR